MLGKYNNLVLSRLDLMVELLDIKGWNISVQTHMNYLAALCGRRQSTTSEKRGPFIFKHSNKWQHKLYGWTVCPEWELLAGNKVGNRVKRLCKKMPPGRFEEQNKAKESKQGDWLIQLTLVQIVFLWEQTAMKSMLLSIKESCALLYKMYVLLRNGETKYWNIDY